MITTINYNPQKISLGSLKDKKSRHYGIKYQNIPIFMTEERHLFICVEDFNGYLIFL